MASPHILLWHTGQAELALSLWWGRAMELEWEILGAEDQLSNFLTVTLRPIQNPLESPLTHL